MPVKRKAASRAISRATHPLERKKAPEFELIGADGGAVALRNLVGKRNLVLYFYPKDMTPGCTKEACAFRDEIADIRAAGADVVGVSPDPAVSHQRFIAAHSLNFPLLSDAGNKVARLYGVYKKKSLYAREFMGIERTTFLIDKQGMVRKVFPKVKVEGHAQAVLGALKELR